MSAGALSVQPGLNTYPRRQMLRDFAIVLSLVNVSYLRVWSELLTVTPADYFYLKQPFKSIDYWAAILGVVGLGVFLWVLTALVRLYAKGAFYRACQLVFLAGAVFGPVLAIRSIVMREANGRGFGGLHQTLRGFEGIFVSLDRFLASKNGRQLAAVLALAALAVSIRFLAPLVRFAAGCLLCASPFVIVTFGEGLYGAVRHEPAIAFDGPTATYLPNRVGARVVWIIFDEWDYRLSFPERGHAVQLDAVDRFANEALNATQAVSPAGDTHLSIPSYTDGRRVTRSEAESETALRLTYLDTGETAIWGSQPNIFAKARASGVNVGVLGWYLPYCREFQSSLVSCSWFSRAIQANTSGDTLAQKLRNQPRSLLETTLFSPFGQSLSVQQHARDYIQMEGILNALVTDTRLGLVYAHLPAPHSPFVYDPATNKLTRKNVTFRGYPDELALLNRTVAGMRKILEDSGTWDETIVLLTSDHRFRNSESLDGKRDPRVPFLLKMRGQHTSLSLDAQFNTVTVGELVLAMLQGDVSTPAQAADWLQKNSRRDGSTSAPRSLPTATASGVP